MLNKKVSVDKLKIELILKLQRSDAVMRRRDLDMVMVLNYMYCHLLTDQGNIIIEISLLFPNCCHSLVVIVADCGA